MNILLLAATPFEIAPLTAHLLQNWQQEKDLVFHKGANRLHILITGVGMVSTTFTLMRQLHEYTCDFVLQAGVGGSFDRSIPLGSMVMVQEDLFGDLGAEDHYHFTDIFELGLCEQDTFPYRQKRLINPLDGMAAGIALPRVTALTVNTVSGSDFTAALRKEKYNCQLESMEGAALHFVCLQKQIPFAQVRSISNYVEARDKSKWKMKEAIEALNSWLMDFTDF